MRGEEHGASEEHHGLPASCTPSGRADEAGGTRGVHERVPGARLRSGAGAGGQAVPERGTGASRRLALPPRRAPTCVAHVERGRQSIYGPIQGTCAGRWRPGGGGPPPRQVWARTCQAQTHRRAVVVPAVCSGKAPRQSAVRAEPGDFAARQNAAHRQALAAAEAATGTS